jgi:peptide deformylase
MRPMMNPQLDRAADAFAAALTQLRGERGLTKKQLAAEMGFDPSYVSHIEARRHRPTEDFARRAEVVLRANGIIWQRFREYEDARLAAGARANPVRDAVAPDQWFPPGTGLIVEREDSSLSYVDGRYVCTVRRALFNGGTEPVTRYLVRISVDRFPGEAERSNKHYREHPLTWAELDLVARCGDEPMQWHPKHDRDADKEVWLLFENPEGRFPLYPGQRCTIDYTYAVGEEKWGHWFQRAIRLPTRKLNVRIDFPAELDPAVWGVETSETAEANPLRTPVVMHDAGTRVSFEWGTENPPLNARYRLEWRFRGTPPPVADGGLSTVDTSVANGQPAVEPSVVAVGQSIMEPLAAEELPGPRAAQPGRRLSPAERMAAAGVVQRGAPVLTRPARWFELPAEEAHAREIVARLLESLDTIGELHHFSKGVGLAAPQLGIGWAATVVRPAGPERVPVVLLNPLIVAASPEQDEQYEGCLSFFDQRGMVARPLWLQVEHSELTGERVLSRYERAMARLVAHEVDHLGGILYPDRMDARRRLIAIDEYRDHGIPWRY